MRVCRSGECHRQSGYGARPGYFCRALLLCALTITIHTLGAQQFDIVVYGGTSREGRR
jgi:hypothetical protein